MKSDLHENSTSKAWQALLRRAPGRHALLEWTPHDSKDISLTFPHTHTHTLPYSGCLMSPQTCICLSPSPTSTCPEWTPHRSHDFFMVSEPRGFLTHVFSCLVTNGRHRAIWRRVPRNASSHSKTWLALLRRAPDRCIYKYTYLYLHIWRTPWCPYIYIHIYICTYDYCKATCREIATRRRG